MTTEKPGKESIMPTHLHPDGSVEIRIARREWAWLPFFAAFWIGMATTLRAIDGEWSGQLYWWLFIATIIVVQAFWVRTRGVILRPDAVVLRNFGTKVLPWQEVQAIAPDKLLGTTRVAIFTSAGKKYILRAPTMTFQWGREEYEQEYHRIGQWWLAYRGPDWRPAW